MNLAIVERWMRATRAFTTNEEDLKRQLDAYVRNIPGGEGMKEKVFAAMKEADRGASPGRWAMVPRAYLLDRR